ncbi:hypothetical protein PUNSTDRAFT_135833 [Punctularia strigosozonata HHB-11173 SS5]|uniref:uncharacterized protein n=1 Tax=Punctularia strigosozonata (strain HHB-11173) TaxID=741275 RepID=UPI0004417427|nr:uncharacterized protein PUNSTDRAFT_135833 [Punctularia strigosozonata HHB-11173 SS5]EIN07150.1 hypothetical protein PUNSTDRAFT_135833 [Punctularia strigosozonata HHB-11173 SS5]
MFLHAGKKASKNSHSTAFHNKKNALFAEARETAAALVEDGKATIEQRRTLFAELKAQESLPTAQFQALKQQHDAQDNIFGEVLDLYPAFNDQLSKKRAEEIDQTLAMLESHQVERKKSHRRAMKDAMICMNEGVENQKLATDASAYIKSFKALLLS